MAECCCTQAVRPARAVPLYAGGQCRRAPASAAVAEFGRSVPTVLPGAALNPPAALHRAAMLHCRCNAAPPRRAGPRRRPPRR